MPHRLRYERHMVRGTSGVNRKLWIERWLGPSIDYAAVDGYKTMWQRLIVAGVATLLVTANLGPTVGAAWLAIAYGGEGLAWFSTRRLMRGAVGTPAERLIYLLCVAILSLNWAFLTLLYWLSGRIGLQFVAIVVASAQLIHAQGFTFRSRAVLAIQATIPGGVLVTLLLFYAGLQGLEWFTAATGIFATLAYVAASARANRLSAVALGASRDELERIAYSDALTTLANRRRFTEDMRRLMDYSRRHGTRFALVLIDLDRFKNINDQLGHDVGDAMLVEAARRLRDLTSGSDCVARLGGDEFAVLIADAADSNRVASFCQKIIENVSAGVNVNGETVGATSSVGVAIYPADGRGADELYKAADLALYDAKNAGRNTWRAFDGGLAKTG
ncbi:MAG: GGDEF domain-containing protein [Sandarakinorhabdus sp.]|nr:GGDEF domain-containing protein [Sandarakinorhabdus sp.]